MSDRKIGRTKTNSENEQAISSSGDSVTKEMRSKSYYGGHKSTILAILDSDRDEEDSYCDVVLQVNDGKFPAHKCILGKLSPFFNKMFKTEMKEKYDSVANIQIVSGEIMGLILQFIYTATVNINEDNVMDVLVASDYMQFDEIKRFCVEFLSESVDKGNCLSMQANGEMFNCPTLTDTAETMAAQNFEEIIQQDEFRELDKKAALSFLKSRDQKAFGSKAVYEGALTWVQHDLESRREDFVDFFKVVKLHLLPASYLEEVVANQELIKESHDCKDYFQNQLLYRLKLPSSVHQHPSSSTNSHSFSEVQTSEEKSGFSKNKSHTADGSAISSPSEEVFADHSSHRNAPSSILTRSSSSSSLQSHESDRVVPSSPLRHFQSPAHSQSTSTDQTAASDVIFSKELVKILRHGKYKDIIIDSEGFASVQHILVNPRFRKVCGSRNTKDVKRIVSGGDKKRFEMKLVGAVWKIRAVSGHTIQIEQAQTSSAADDQYGYSGRVRSHPSSSASDDFPKLSFSTSTNVSKELVRILRHGRYKDIHVDSAGYASVHDILDNRNFRKVCGDLSVHALMNVVQSARKKYFEIEVVDSELKIKALHGHSINVEDLDLTPLCVFDLSYMYVYHQTTFEAWEKIKRTGLSKMKRTHIHFTSIDVSRRNTARSNSEIVIEIHLESAMDGGLTFYESSNNVVLSEGDQSGKIHPKFFNRAFQLNPYQELEFSVPPDFPGTSRDHSKPGPSRRNWRHKKNPKKGSD